MVAAKSIDGLFEVLSRYVRLRDRVVHATVRSIDGDYETAALRGLFHLDRKAMRSRDLAEALYADPSTVSRHVAQLVDLGLVRREADPDDGRATLLVITDAGRERVESMRATRRLAMQDALAGWTDDEMDSLTTLLDRFVGAAEDVLSPTVGKDGGRADA